MYKAMINLFNSVQFSSLQSLSHVWFFATPWTTACQASLSISPTPIMMDLEIIILSEVGKKEKDKHHML